jgi:deaminated glutathione amidase
LQDPEQGRKSLEKAAFYMSKVGIVQVQSSIEKKENLQRALELVKESKSAGADLVVFPEFLMSFSPASQTAKELAEIAEPLEGPFIKALKEAANATRTAIVATIYETCSIDDRVYDTAIWIDADGSLAAVYRKLHLYDAFGFRESDKFAAGVDLTQPVTLEDGRYGMMICYDLRFPEMARMLALSGANILLAPSGWVQGDLKVDHWQTMIRARALENGCYVIAPDQVGNIYIGHSMVVDPLGRTVVDLGEREAVELVEIDHTLVQDTRAKLPLLQNRRSDIYQKYSLLP